MRQLRLKDLGRWYSGGTPPKDDEAAWDGDLPWLSAKDISSTELRDATTFITEEAGRRHSHVAPSGSLLVIVRGMALAHGVPVALLSSRAAFNQDLRALVPDPAHDPRFLHYAIIGARPRLDRHIDRAAHGTARLLDSFMAERIRVMERPTQVRIADFLDRECSQIAELLQELDGAVTLAELKVVSQLEASLFEDGIDGWFGKSRWSAVPLGSIGYLTDGDWIESPFITNEGIRLIQTGNIGRGTFRGASRRCVSAATFAELRCTEVLPSLDSPGVARLRGQ